MAALETEIVFDPIFGGRAVRKVVKEAGNIGKKSGASFSDNFEKVVGTSLRSSAIAGIGAALSAAFATGASVATAAEFERLNTQLEVLTGSAKEANKVFEQLKDFSAETPFRLQDITAASAKLISFGFSSAEVRDRIKEVGEVAAGSGAELGEVALIFGQVAAAGKLTGERLLQLQERAIPIGPAIAKTLGVAESQIRKLVSQGKVSAEVFQKAFASLSAAGGQFEGSLEKQSRTISGALSTLGDNFSILQAEFGKAFGPGIVDLAQEFSKVIQDIVVIVKDPEFQRSITEGFGKLANIFLITPAKFWVDFFSGDTSQNLSQINAEIEKFEKQLTFAQEKLQKTSEGGAGQKATFFGGLFGGFNQAREDIVNIEEQLASLEKRRIALINQGPDLARSIKEVANNEEELEKQRAVNAQKQADRQAEALKNLGTIGLTQEQQLLAKLQKEQELINQAEATKAISEDEANARRIQRQTETESQITAIKEQEAQKREAARQEALQRELEAEQTLSDILGNTSKRFKDVAKDFRVTSRDISKALVNGIGNAAANAFSSFGRALATGQDALKAFGQALLAAFGQSLVQLGTGFILQGVAQSLAGFGSGAPLIAAGAALATFGGVLSGLSGGASGGAGATTSAGGGIAGSGGTFDSDVTAPAEEREDPGTSVQVTIQGDVLDSDETGTRIVSLINDAFEKDGVVVRNFAAV